MINSKIKIKHDTYDEHSAADSFTRDILEIYRSKKQRQTLLILFDEIERISPHTGSSEHWLDGDDFVLFWQTLRAFFQRNPNVLTYILVGTNPTCIELPRIGHHDNPLFGSIHVHYVPSFSVDQTKEMVSKLGLYMGLKFDEVLYSQLVIDFGGHPFLIRQFCSEIHEACRGKDRPLLVDRALYSKAIEEFQDKAVNYLEMIVDVLGSWYKDEHDMLMFLARGDVEMFSQFANENMRYTRHLIGYELITRSEYGYTFNIDALKGYVNRVQRYKKLNLSKDEKRDEISQRRNNIEMGLRVVIKTALILSRGEKQASQSVLNSLTKERRERMKSSDINELLSRENSLLFFSELVSIIRREWEHVKHIFGDRSDDKRRVEVMLDDINLVGRPDAHARYVDEDDFSQLRLYFKRLERILNKWTA